MCPFRVIFLLFAVRSKVRSDRATYSWHEAGCLAGLEHKKRPLRYESNASVLGERSRCGITRYPSASFSRVACLLSRLVVYTLVHDLLILIVGFCFSFCGFIFVFNFSGSVFCLCFL